MKETPWEGGVRGVAAMWSPILSRPGRVSNVMMHMSDWLPTLWSAAGGNSSALPLLDGVDQWAALSQEHPSRRLEVLHNIDDIDKYAALRRGDWKYVTGELDWVRFESAWIRLRVLKAEKKNDLSLHFFPHFFLKSIGKYFLD